MLTITGTIIGEQLRNYWGSEKLIKYKDKTFRVGKMSYGTYFLEPFKEEQKERPETLPQVRGTL